MLPYFVLISQFLSPWPKGSGRGGLSEFTVVRIFFLCDHLWMGSSQCFGEIYFLNFTHQWDNKSRKSRKEESYSKAIIWDQLKEQDNERKVIMEISGNPINLRFKKFILGEEAVSKIFTKIYFLCYYFHCCCCCFYHFLFCFDNRK